MAKQPEDKVTITGPNGETLYEATSEQFLSDAERAATEAALGHNSKANGPDLLNMNDSLTETAREKLRMTVIGIALVSWRFEKP